MNFKQSIFIAFIFISSKLMAQPNFKEGYVIANSGDTLHGMIDYRGDIQMSKVCKFQDSNSNTTEYSPNDIKAFRFTDGKYYISKEINGKNVFVEYLVEGKISIYYLLNYNGNHYYLSKDSTQLTEIPYEEEIKIIEKHKLFYTTTRHIGVLSIFMKDVPELQPQINRIKKPDHQNLIKLAEEYNSAVCKGEKCIIYEKKQSGAKLFLEPIYGIAYYSSFDDLVKGTYNQKGMLFNIWLPQANESFYFKSGLLLTKVVIGDNKETLYKIPIQIEYISPKSPIHLKFGAGFNFFMPFYHSVAIKVGVNGDITKSVFWSINWDLDYIGKESFPILPRQKLSHAYSIGLYIRIK